MEFAYRLTGTGWAQARLVDGDQSIELKASYLSDAPDALLLAIGAIQEGADSTRCSWELEPGEIRWLFSRDGARLRLRILTFSDAYPRYPDAEGEVVFQLVGGLVEVQRAFVGGMRAVLDEWGEDGYLLRWAMNPFPTELLTLSNPESESSRPSHRRAQEWLTDTRVR